MAKKSTQSSEKSDAKQNSNGKNTEKTKQPLISTGKKIGIAVYFTFLATLAGVMGVQILLTQNLDTPTTTDTYSTNIVETQQPSTDPQNQTNQASNYSDFPIDEKAPRHNVATPFDGNASMTAPDVSPVTQNPSSTTNAENLTPNDTTTQPSATVVPNESSSPSTDPTTTAPKTTSADSPSTDSTSPTTTKRTSSTTQPETSPSCPDGNCDLTTAPACPDGNCIA